MGCNPFSANPFPVARKASLGRWLLLDQRWITGSSNLAGVAEMKRHSVFVFIVDSIHLLLGFVIAIICSADQEGGDFQPSRSLVVDIAKRIQDGFRSSSHSW